MTVRTHASNFWRAICLLSLFAAAPSHAGTVHHVTTTNDDGSPESLRYEVDHAVDGDVIEFQLTDCPCVISIIGDPIEIRNNITINGPGMKLLALDGAKANGSVIYSVAASLVIANLSVRGGHNSRAGDDSGAAVWIAGQSNVLSNVAFTDNKFGALLIENGGATEISNSLFQNNVSDNYFGMTIFQNPCTECSLLVVNTSFVGNSARSCAAILSQGPTVVENSTFTGNTALPSDGSAQHGGAICIAEGEIRSSTFVNNSASGRGGALSIYEFARSVTIANSVFTLNYAPLGPDISGSVISWGHNLVTDRSGSFGFQKPTCDPLSSGTFPGDLPEEDPKLAPVHVSKLSGLPIVTPNPGSPLIDAISIGHGHCDGIDVPKTDARGIARPQGARADIGAVEFVPDDDRIFCDEAEATACKPLG